MIEYSKHEKKTFDFDINILDSHVLRSEKRHFKENNKLIRMAMKER